MVEYGVARRKEMLGEESVAGMRRRKEGKKEMKEEIEKKEIMLLGSNLIFIVFMIFPKRNSQFNVLTQNFDKKGIQV